MGKLLHFEIRLSKITADGEEDAHTPNANAPQLSQASRHCLPKGKLSMLIGDNGDTLTKDLNKKKFLFSSKLEAITTAREYFDTSFRDTNKRC